VISGKVEAPVLKKFVVGALATNCYLLWEKDSHKGILIDPGAYEKEITSYIKNNGIEVLYILNTHGHADHISADAAFGYPVLIHKLDEACLKDPLRNLSFMHGETTAPPETARLLSDGDIIEVGSTRLEVIHTPGHTPGGISARCGELLFTGDTLFFEGVGRTDLAGGSYHALEKSIKEKLFMLPDSVKVFPGHGPQTTIGYEKRHNPLHL